MKGERKKKTEKAEKSLPLLLSPPSRTTQCRQKTVEMKAKCGVCTLFWCPRCLANRYGEEVDQVREIGRGRRERGGREAGR